MPCNCPTTGGAQHYTFRSALDDDDNQTSTWSPPVTPPGFAADTGPLVVIKRGTTITSTLPGNGNGNGSISFEVDTTDYSNGNGNGNGDEEAPFPWLALAIGVTGVFMFAGKRRR